MLLFVIVCHMWPHGNSEFREMWEEFVIEGRLMSCVTPWNSGIPGNVGRVWIISFRLSYAAPGNSRIPGIVGRIYDFAASHGKVYNV